MIRRWLDRRAALRCLAVMHREVTEDAAAKDDDFLVTEAWLWAIAGEPRMAAVLLKAAGRMPS
jgi:hypothetical protein